MNDDDAMASVAIDRQQNQEGTAFLQLISQIHFVTNLYVSAVEVGNHPFHNGLGVEQLAQASGTLHEAVVWRRAVISPSDY